MPTSKVTKASAAAEQARMDEIHESRAKRHDRVDRWRIERAGAPGGLGYGLGWVAMSSGNAFVGVGGWFPTWRQAIDYAHEQTRIGIEATA